MSTLTELIIAAVIMVVGSVVLAIIARALSKPRTPAKR